jgi:hypothetical protein
MQSGTPPNAVAKISRQANDKYHHEDFVLLLITGTQKEGHILRYGLS